MARPVIVACALLLASGYCALVYETAWLRSLRGVFGASTAASAAVLAVFVGGLGLGGLALGRRADASRTPLLLYGALELGIAAAAAASPWLVDVARAAYVGLGGVEALGEAGAAVTRLALTAIVLGPPAFLMGGTLPVMARAAGAAEGPGRRHVGALYAANTLGAVAATLLTTFLYIEAFGVRRTIWLASAVNLMVALSAFALHLLFPEEWRHGPASAPSRRRATAPPATVPVLVSAAVVGLAFFVMELVWYRMLAPLLGGSSYTFGLVLAVALLGIGLGGALYAAQTRKRTPSLADFAWSCALEALLVALPLALGDPIALLAISLRDLGNLGLAYLVATWGAVAGLVVLPAALVAGYQFPLLVAILGGGEERVGREVGLVYACNTAGSVGGAIAGGFVLIPWLTAPGTWRGVALLLAALAAGAFAADWRLRGRRAGVPAPLGVAAAAFALALLPGPTAFWRHQPIGAGRTAMSPDPNAFEAARRSLQRALVWEADGRESSLGLSAESGYALLVNGKSDGHARRDAATTVMLPMIGAVLHPDPRTALVIGLGSGASAGWLAQVDSIERVQVVELEPQVSHVARLCSAVNFDVLSDPKVEIHYGDARERLLATHSRYDLIVSEPSNPYRAGVASLFSREYYRAASERLQPDGLFVQWLQAYEVDTAAVRTLLATLRSVFAHVEIWEVSVGADLALVAANAPLVHDFATLATRVETHPYASALQWTWGVGGLPGLYVGYVASDALARRVRDREGERLDTDDHPILEFAFARSLGRRSAFDVEELRDAARRREEHRPEALPGMELDWALVEDLRSARFAFQGRAPGRVRLSDPEAVSRARARQAYANGRLPEALRRWREQSQPPATHIDLLLVAESLAAAADAEALAVSDQLERVSPPEASAARSLYWLNRNLVGRAGEHLAEAFVRLRRFPWVADGIVQRSGPRALEIAARDAAWGRRLFEAIGEPFAVALFEAARLETRVELAHQLGAAELCREALQPLEPHFPWQRSLLTVRLECYAKTSDPRVDVAAAEIAAFLRQADERWEGVREDEAPRPGINDAYLDADLDIDEWIARFEVESREIYARRQAIVASLGLEPGMAVGDIGAGTGLFLAPFDRGVGASGAVYAVEISPRFLEHLRERARTEGLSSVRVVTGTQRSVELSDASLDIAFLCNVYHHLESPKAILAGLMRAIRPGGELVVVDFRRIPGVSREFVLGHVRAGQEVFTREIREAGFELIEEIAIDGLEENYALRFRRPDSPRAALP